MLDIKTLEEELLNAFPEAHHHVVLPSRFRRGNIELHSSFPSEKESSGYKHIHIVIGTELPDSATSLINQLKTELAVDK